MKLAVVLGTRPEIIKMSPIIRECELRGVEYFILHSGQHYSFNMDRAFFEELELPEPDYNLEVGSGLHGEQTGKILMGCEKVFLKEEPDMVLVQGDTNTTMSGALAAAKLHVGVGHVEAGLRSFDRGMPEEVNRVVADHVSDQLYAPTMVSRGNLLREGIPDERIYVTGNTIVDAVYQNLELSKKKVDPLKDLGLENGRYLLTTIHRAENVDNPAKLKGILNGLREAAEHTSLPIVFPMHPRTMKRVEEYGYDTFNIIVVEPQSFLKFLQLEAHAKLILTDSGGIQEEACILRVPCVTVRENTERPETVEAGANIVAGTTPENILHATERMLKIDRGWDIPFGDGKAAEKIVTIIVNGM